MQKLQRGVSPYDPGYIYIVRTGNNVNEIKIGLTRETSQRLRTLFNTSVALPFNPKAIWKVPSMKPAEEAAHEIMREHRINDDRELFHVIPPVHGTAEERTSEEFSDSSIDKISEWIEDGFYQAGIEYERVYL